MSDARRCAGRSSRVGDQSQDPLGSAIAAFLEDVLDGVRVAVHADRPIGQIAGPGTEGDLDRLDRVVWIPEEPVRGGDGRSRQFSLVSASSAFALPSELADLPAAALRALDRLARPDRSVEPVHPGIARALHEAIVAEVLADRIPTAPGVDIAHSERARVMAEILDYASELAATQLEGDALTHGVVVAGTSRGLEPVTPAVPYPGRLPTRKRTSLMYDGSESVLVVTPSGHVLQAIDDEVPPPQVGRHLDVARRRDALGLEGALTAAASAAFDGVGVLVRADRTIWIFDRGEPLFIRRTTRWKSIAIRSFGERIGSLAGTSTTIAVRVARAAVRASIHGHGALLAIASDAAAIAPLVHRDHDASEATAADSVDQDLQRIVARSGVPTAMAVARLARLDGATILDRDGRLLAYGAIVRSTDSHGEGARTAAARALSKVAGVAISVSQDGPITVFREGDADFGIL